MDAALQCWQSNIAIDVIKTADHVIDLGPEGGHAGGQIVATGTPEQVAACKASHTGEISQGASGGTCWGRAQ